MELSIPKRHKGAFIRFLRLSPSVMRGLIRALKRASPKTSILRLSSQLPLESLGLDRDSAHGIVSFLASLYRYRTDHDVPVERFASDIVAAAKDESRNFPDSRKRDWSLLKKCVLEILKLDRALGLTAKASELTSENERLLCPLNCRVLSDARPLFLGDPSKSPSAMIVQHVLKIAYHGEGDDVKEFFVTMDGDDLSYLQFLLSRAEIKERSIRKFMKNTGISVLRSDEE